MRSILLALLLLTSCGEETEFLLPEGIYYVQLIATENTCGWASGDAGDMLWEIIRIGDRYGITHQGNNETLACETILHSRDIACNKEKDAWVEDCKWHVVQSVIIEPREDSFVGTFEVEFNSCEDTSCGQKAIIEGSFYY